MKPRVFLHLAISIFLLASLIGCGPARANLKGKVTLDGKPFVGLIIAVSKDSPNDTGSGNVINMEGDYEIKSAPIGKVVLIVEPLNIPGITPEKGRPGQPRPQMAPPTGTVAPNEAWSEANPRPPALANKEWVTPQMMPLIVVAHTVDPKFTNTKTSPLETELKAGSNSSFPIPLTSGK